MRWWILAAILFLLLVIQLGLEHLGLPHSPLLILVYLCLLVPMWRMRDFFVAALIAGLMLDWLSGLPDGIFMISLPAGVLLGYWVAGSISEKFQAYVVPASIITATIGYWAIAQILISVMAILGWTHQPVWSFVSILLLLWIILWNLVAIIPLYLILELHNKLEKRFVKKHEFV